MIVFIWSFFPLSIPIFLFFPFLEKIKRISTTIGANLRKLKAFGVIQTKNPPESLREDQIKMSEN